MAAKGDEQSRPLLEVRNLKVHFPIRRGVFKRTVGHVRAVDGVSLAIRPGRTLALVGESGCGKTTVGKGLLQLIRPTAGEVDFDGTALTALRGERLRRRRADFQIVFQDPYASLNPRMRVYDIRWRSMARSASSHPGPSASAASSSCWGRSACRPRRPCGIRTSSRAASASASPSRARSPCSPS
jgi:peptide/nickel transport system ATP-binding protein